MSSIKAVIFDMDGVIVDGETIQSKAFERLIRSYGKVPTFNKSGLIHNPGPSGDASYKALMKEYGIKENLGIIRKKCRKIFREFLKERLSPMPGFPNLMKLIKKNKIRAALASNRFIDHIYIMVNNLGLEDFFEIIVGPGPDIRHKPLPDIYLKTAEKLKISPVDCVAIEDTETGVISAKSAGMKVIAVPNIYTKHQDFSKADKIVKSLSDISLNLINNL